VALAYVALGAPRKYGLGQRRAPPSVLQVLESTTLAPNRSIYVVRVADRRLVLGVTTQQITTLAELEDEEPVARGEKLSRAVVSPEQGVDFQAVLDGHGL